MSAAWDVRDPERIAVGRWLGPPLSPGDAERVLGIVHWGTVFADDFPDSGNERWQWFVQAATVLEGMDPEDRIVRWTIACFLDRFPYGRDRADGSLWYDPPEKALMFGRMSFLNRFDPELYALAERRLDWRHRVSVAIAQGRCPPGEPRRPPA